MAELPYSQAKNFVDSLVSGISFSISMPDSELLFDLADKARSLGAICHLEEITRKKISRPKKAA